MLVSFRQLSSSVQKRFHDIDLANRISRWYSVLSWVHALIDSGVSRILANLFKTRKRDLKKSSVADHQQFRPRCDLGLW